MPRVYALIRLKREVQRAAYERWVREVDYPLARTLPSISAYTNHRLTPFRKDAPYDYMEIIHVHDLEAYRADLNSPAVQDLGAQYREFVDSVVSFVGEPIE